MKYDNNCDLTVEHKKSMSESIKMLNNTSKKTLRLPKSDLQYIILPDTSYISEGYVPMVEAYVLNHGGQE